MCLQYTKTVWIILKNINLPKICMFSWIKVIKNSGSALFSIKKSFVFSHNPSSLEWTYFVNDPSEMSIYSFTTILRMWTVSTYKSIGVELIWYDMCVHVSALSCWSNMLYKFLSHHPLLSPTIFMKRSLISIIILLNRCCYVINVITLHCHRVVWQNIISP